ncbi:antitoxin HicB [Brevibacterium luteolum]|nr:antitoxin HicB [Brevibacterium luteolum]
MNSITVTARQWSGGWELEIDQDNITQVRSLANASAQVVDYLDTLDPTVDHRTWDVHIVPDLGDLTQKFEESKRATAEAAALQVRAGQLSRELVRELRSRNFSVSDVAVMLNVSRGRVSQLDR